jgi:ribose-phosphate pyrophosphokinase
MIFIDGKLVQFGMFPNKESNLNFNNVGFHTHSVVALKFESDLDLFNLYILKSYMDENGCKSPYLKILYMPYSRMDRRNEFYTFNLKYVSNFINSMNFAQVEIFDAHSDVTSALVDRCIDRSNIPYLFTTFQKEVGTENTVIMYPDAGAQKRYERHFAYPSVVGKKVRSFGDGKILSYEITGDAAGKNVVIVDDLCSRGGTFMGAANALKDTGAKDLYLIVSHCENTILEGDVLSSGLFKKVYTTNSIISETEATDSFSVLNIYGGK